MKARTEIQDSLNTPLTRRSLPGVIKLMAAAALAALLSSGGSMAYAQSGQDTWVGNTSVNWADLNWSGVNNPPKSGDGLIFGAAGTAGTALNDNLTTGSAFVLTNITYLAAAPSFLITPGPTAGFTLGTATAAIVITQGSANPQTNNDSFTLGAAIQTNVLTTNLTLGGNISGNGGLSVTGTGTLTLSGTNSYTNTTTIGAGTTLNITGAGQLGNGTYAANITDNGAFVYSSTTNQNLSYPSITGTGSLTNNGPGLLILSGSTAPPILTGNITVNSGAIIVFSNGFGGNTTTKGPLIINPGGEMDLSANDVTGYETQDGPITNAGIMKKIANQSETFFRPTYLNNGSFVTTLTNVEQFELFGGFIATMPGTANFVSGPGKFGLRTTTAFFNVAANSTLTFSSAIDQNSGGAALIQIGPGTLVLANTNTFNSGILNSNTSGTLLVNASGQLGSTGTVGNAAFNITNFGIFAYNSASNQTFSGILSATVPPIFTNTGTVSFAASGTATFTVPISGTGSLTNNGPGTVLLLGSNTFTGNTTVNGGIIWENAAQTSTSPVIVNDGGAFGVSSIGSAHYSPASLALGSSAGAVLQVGLSSTTQAPLTPVTLALTGSNAVILSGGFAPGNSYPVLSYATVSGAGTLNFIIPKGVTGTVTLAANLYTLNVTAVIPTIWTGAVNGTWDINTTANWSFNGVAGNYFDGSPVQFDDTGLTALVTNLAGTLSPSTIVVSNANNNYVFSNNIAIGGGGGLIKNGSGSLTLDTPNTYTGPTVINAGSVVVGVAAARGPGALGLNSTVTLSNNAGAVLNLNGNSTQIGSLSGGGAAGGNVTMGAGSLTFGSDNTSQTYGGVISGTGGITKLGGGSLTLTGVNAFSGSIPELLGNLFITGAGQLNSGTYGGTILNNGSITYSSATNQFLTGTISGAGGITVNGGPGTVLQLGSGGGAFTYTGATLVNVGQLNLNFGNSGTSGISASSKLTINSGATVQVNGDNALCGSTTGIGSLPIFVNAGGTLTGLGTADSGNGTSSHIRGVLTLNGGTLADGGSGAQPAFGTWDLDDGVAVSGASTTTSTMSALDIIPDQSGGTQFNITNGGTASGIDLAVTGSLIKGTSAADTGIIKGGNGTMALMGANTYTGTTTINGGTLLLADPGQLGGTAGTFTGNIVDNAAFVVTTTQAQTFFGVISGTGSLAVYATSSTAVPSLVLDGVSTYTGATMIGNFTTLSISLGGSIAASSPIIISNGGSFDVSSVTTPPYVMGPTESLYGNGTVNGALTASSGTRIFPGTDGTYGTNTFTGGGLNLAIGATVNVDLGTVYNQSNDLLVVSGPLAVGVGDFIHVKAPSIAVGLDQSADYVLITASGGITGAFSTAPAFDVVPTNASHFSVVTGANQVTLHYSTTSSPLVSSSTATPSSGVLRNQSVVVSVSVTPGANPVSTVSLGLGPLGGTSTNLVQVGATSVYTNTIVVPASVAAGPINLTALVTDSANNNGAGNVGFTVVTSTETWNGLGANGNWDTNPNWASTYAPGNVGDSLVFAGLVNTNANMDQTYTVQGFTFAAGATNFNIGTTTSSSLTVLGGITNNSTNAQVLNVPVNTAGPLLIYSGVPGSGTVTLGGGGTSNSITVQGGSLALGGNNGSSTTLTTVGTPTSTTNATLILGSGTANVTNNDLWIGEKPGVAGAVYQSNGTMTLTQGGSVNDFSLGAGSNGYGYYALSGGVLNSQEIDIGGDGSLSTAATLGVMDITGGTFNDGGWLNVGHGTTTSSGVLNVSGTGSILCNSTVTSAHLTLNQSAGAGAFSLVNVFNGGTISGTPGNITFDANLSLTSGAGSFGIINLNSGGKLMVSAISDSGAASTCYLNFNGGILQATINNPNFITSGNITGIYDYAGGATLDDGGNNVTNSRGILAPSGYGVSSIGITSGGSNYVGAPILIVSGGAGVDATAIAQLNLLTGVITNILVTSPGTGFASSDTLTVTNIGGGGSGLKLGTPVLAANVSGGLVKQDFGILYLSGVSTYTNITTILGGTLGMITGGSIANSPLVYITNGGTFDLTYFPGFVLPAGQNLAGSGAVSGSIQIANGSKVFPGTDGTVGTLSFQTGLTLGSGATANFDLSTSGFSGNDQINVTGTLSLNGNSLHVKAAGTLDQINDYTLITATAISGSFASTPVFDGTPPSNAQFYTVQKNGASVILHYSTSHPATAVGTATPSPVLANAVVNFNVAVTPGSSPTINSVVVDVSSLGGVNVPLTNSGGNVWIGATVVPPSANPGGATLAATITDANLLQGVIGVPLTVATTNEVWAGLGVNPNWATNANWTSLLAPGYNGDNLIFAGNTDLTPNMDTNYNVSITFSNNAGAFNIGSSNGSVLTLTTPNGVSNNAPGVELVNVPVVLNGTGTLWAATNTSGLTLTQPISGLGVLNMAGPGSATLQGTNIYTGNTTISAGSTLNIGSTGQLGNGTYTANVVVNGTLAYSGTNTQTISGAITGTGGLTQNGPGTLTVPFGSDTETGNWIVNGGILFASSGVAGSGTARGALTVNPGGEVDCNVSDTLGYAISNPITNAGVIKKLNNQPETLFRPVYMSNGTLATTISGAEQFETDGGFIQTLPNTTNYINGPGLFGVRTASCYINAVSNSVLIFSVPIDQNVNASGSPFNQGIASGGGTGTIIVTVPFASAAAPFVGTVNIFSGTLILTNTCTLGGGTYANTIANSGAFIYSGSNPQTFTGVISGAGTNEVIGPGALETLTAVNTYTGPTIVNNGSLIVAAGASIAGSSLIDVQTAGVLDVSALNGFTLGASQTLRGSGNVLLGSGSLTNNGTLSAGEANAMGTLTLNNGLFLAGASKTSLRINKTGAVTTSDKVSGITAATYNGTLTVTNTGSSALAVGDSFVLFSATSASGNYTNIVGPTGVTFSFTPNSGVLAVTGVPVITPTNFTFSVSAGKLNLAWPASYLGWNLQSNSINIIVPADWFTIAGSSAVTNESITIGTNPAVFFRMQHP